MPSKTPIAAIFSALQGTWRLKRSLTSTLPDSPSGTFTGTASFSPRKPTAETTAGELLYAEQGELKTDTGLTLTANRKYIYRYNADEDKISAWFVTEDSKTLDGKEEVDYLFHDLEMEQSKNGVWAGRGEHLCELDMYWAYYEFRLKDAADLAGVKGVGGEMDVFGVRYKVKGPQKDYSSDTAYERVIGG